ncbi:MAG TPA: M20 family metallo-hydrolase [Candidatus Dormibacteraeota bacterium]|nr:M20 family metallo-hydrolase [Candidatus Dormibacteraeota bacterium]
MSSSLVSASPGEPSETRLWAALMRLAEFVEPGQAGWTRRVFSCAYMESRALVRTMMEEAGLAVTQDPVGNLIGRLGGRDPALPPLVVGSHTDTVSGGGRFDGMVGVVAAIEVARTLATSSISLRRPLWIVDFLGEEPNRFGLSCLGSRAVTGHLTEQHMDLIDDAGLSLGEELRRAGWRPDDLGSARWQGGSLHAYLELHIEQGAQLERAGRQIGIVTAIAGISRARIDIEGRADHAGTTPMELRLDALQAAAEIVLATDAIGRDQEGGEEGVATVGRLLVEPNVTNVIPARAQLGVELRSIAPRWLEQRSRDLELLVDRVARERRLVLTLEWLSTEPPVRCDGRLRRAMGRAASQVGADPFELPSGASHDAAHIARIAPMGMLFIPSRGGRSHCPEEWSEPAEVALGARSLLQTVLDVDAAQL